MAEYATAIKATNVKMAALMSPRGSFEGTKFNNVVAIVPMKTDVFSHFYVVRRVSVIRRFACSVVPTKNVRSAAK